MSVVAAAVIGSAVVGAYGVSQSSKAAKSAANSQASSAQQGIDAQNAQFEKIQAMLKPYVDASTGPNGSLAAQQNLIGLNGNAAQQTAIDGIKNSSQFNELNMQGQNAILQNASATGGLRGGNVQGALAQFSPNLLNSLIQDQYAKLGGITSIGQNAAAGVGNAGMNNANQVSSLLGQQGQALAGGALAQGQAANGYSNVLSNSLGLYSGLGGFNSGASSAPMQSFNVQPGTLSTNPSLLQRFAF